MDRQNGSDPSREEVYSDRVRAGKRTYFFDVRATRANDYYITITESKRRHDDRGYEKHKIFLYKEDFNKFQNALIQAVDFVKTELLPDYDYEEFDRKDEDFAPRTNTGSSFDETPASDEELSTTWDD